MKYLSAVFLFFNCIFVEAQTPPLQPGSGPGSSSYVHNGVTFSNFTSAFSGDGYWLFEPNNPKPDSANVVVFNHGYGVYNPGPYGKWIEHLVRKGNIVIFPKYQVSEFSLPNTYTPNAVTGIQNAFIELNSNGTRVKPRMEHYAIIGHSYGGVITSNIAVNYAAYGLPKPQCFMLCEPGTGGLNAGRLASYAAMETDYYALIVVGNNDIVVGDAFGKEIMDSTLIPTAYKNYIIHYADNHGSPAIEASHNEPLAANNTYDGGTVSTIITGGYVAGKTDAVDFYCYWKLADALMECTFYGTHCNYAFGDTFEQQNMGQWSDGTAVIPLDVFPKSVVSVEPLTLARQQTVFPNPVKNILNVADFSKTCSIYEVFNSKGQSLIKNSLNESSVVDVAFLPPGFYFVAFQSDTTFTTLKFFKE